MILPIEGLHQPHADLFFPMNQLEHFNPVVCSHFGMNFSISALRVCFIEDLRKSFFCSSVDFSGSDRMIISFRSIKSFCGEGIIITPCCFPQRTCSFQTSCPLNFIIVFFRPVYIDLMNSVRRVLSSGQFVIMKTMAAGYAEEEKRLTKCAAVSRRSSVSRYSK